MSCISIRMAVLKQFQFCFHLSEYSDHLRNPVIHFRHQWKFYESLTRAQVYTKLMWPKQCSPVTMILNRVSLSQNIKIHFLQVVLQYSSEVRFLVSCRQYSGSLLSPGRWIREVSSWVYEWTLSSAPDFSGPA